MCQVSYTYDAFGDRATQSLPIATSGLAGGPTTTYRYDLDGRTVGQTDPLGNVTTYAFDAFGNQVSQSMPNSSTGAAGGATTSASYDAMGNTLSLTDADGNTTNWSYDGLGREIQQSETVALGYKPGTSTLQASVTAVYNNQYDLDGNLTQATDADGRVNTYSYNWMNQEMGATWYSSAAAAAAGVSDGTVSYTYDVEGEMLTAANTVNGSSVASYTLLYDLAGNLQETAATLAGVASGPIQVGSVYDYNGDLTSTAVNIGGTPNFANGVFSGFTGGINDFVNNYTYDPLGNMLTVTQAGQTSGSCNGVTSKTAAFSYDNDGHLTSLNCTDGAGANYTSTYSYDHDSRLTDLTTSAGSAALAGYHWDYDADSRVSDMYSRNDSSSGTPSSGYSGGNWGKSVYTYDHDSQLTGTSYSSFASPPASNTSQSYDSNGNRTNNGSPGAANRLLSDGSYDYTYDADGNRIARTQISNGAVTYYQWNNANQLTAVSGSAGDVTYTYNASGQMVSRTTGGASENYIYDGQNLALVLNSNGEVTQRELYGAAVDQVLASEAVATVPSGAQAAGTVSWLLGDNQGTIRDVVRYSAGATAVVDHLVYDSFGQVTSQTSPASQPRFTYAGRQFDSVSGLYYNRARWYDAANGVFISPDPTEFAAGDTNLSRYCENSPTNATDPTGLDSSDDGGWMLPQPRPLPTPNYPFIPPDPLPPWWNPTFLCYGGENPATVSNGGSGQVGIENGLTPSGGGTPVRAQQELPAIPDPSALPGIAAWRELQQIMFLATLWNQTSRGALAYPYHFCYEQATDLETELKRNKWKYWKFTVVSRYHGISPYFWSFKANALQVYPTLGSQNPWPSFVLYPWKILNGPAPVQFWTYEEYVKQYPYELR